jgi:hypothetical protein
MVKIQARRNNASAEHAEAASRAEEPVLQQDVRPVSPRVPCPGLLRSVAAGGDEIGGSPVPGDVLEFLRRSRGQGAALPPALGTTMGAELGADLSGVRIHTGAGSDAAARSLQAVAFADGANLHFSAGAYAPSTDSGRRLLAHEVSHVVQPPAPSGVPMVGRADDPAERAADRSASRLVDALRRSAIDNAAATTGATPAEAASTRGDPHQPASGRGWPAELRSDGRSADRAAVPLRRQTPAGVLIRRMTDVAATTAMNQGEWVWLRAMGGPYRVLIRSVDNGTATVDFDNQHRETVDLQDLTEGLPPDKQLAHWIASYLVEREPLEAQLGLEFVRGEVLMAFRHAREVLPYVRTASTDPTATTTDVIYPVRESLREIRDLRHVSWLNEQRAAFDKKLAQLGIRDPRGSTLREHREVTDPHYTALDRELGMPGMLWRFTSNPMTEVISIAPGVDFEKIVRLVAGHTGGNKKDDGSVRTLSFGRNLAALVGVAHSKGGDANVAAINARAEYLYGVSLDSLKGQGITAHPAEARMIGIFETEYVLVGSPGAPPRRLEDLATAKYRNPFKTVDGGQIPELPGKGLAPTKAHDADPPSPDLTDAPEGFRTKVIDYALKVAAAANNQSGTVQDKEGVSAGIIKSAVAMFIRDIAAYDPRRTGPQPMTSGPLTVGKPRQLSSAPRSLTRSPGASSRVVTAKPDQAQVRPTRPPVDRVRQQRVTTPSPRTPEKDPTDPTKD